MNKAPYVMKWALIYGNMDVEEYTSLLILGAPIASFSMSQVNALHGI